MHELITNLHMHTTYSDGHTSHAGLVKAGLQSGLDVVIVTDHNVWVDGPEDIYQEGKRRLLLLVGEEIHDQSRQPQKNHLLVIGAGKELAPLAGEPQRLLNAVRQAGGLAFLAHIIDPAAPAVGEADLSWEDWQVQGYNGIELWNSMSEFKGLLKNKLLAIYYALNPRRIAHGPYPAALKKWDELLAGGQRVSAVGGSDAHALPIRLGPFRRTIFPYEFHFKCINTHLLTPAPLSGELEKDRRMVLEALAGGHAFIGYDLPAPTRGFRFSAAGLEQTAQMGDEISAKNGVTFQIRLPRPVNCCLIRDGKPVKSWEKRETCTYITTEPGAYRVEAMIDFEGKARGWIYSNPIYVVKPRQR